MTQVELSKVIVKKRFRKDLGDIKSLENSFKEIGIIHPIVLDKNNLLVAGRRRLEAARKLKWKTIPYTRINIDINDIWKGEIHENTIRKDFAIEEIVELKRVLEKKRKSGNLPESKGRDTREIVADIVNVSPRQVSKMENLVEAAQKTKQGKNLLLRVNEGYMSVDTAHNLVTRKERNLPKTPPPKGEFDVFLCDVPIAFDDKGGRGAAENHYVTMPAQELAEMRLHSAENAIMFFWVPPSIEYSEMGVTPAWPNGTPIYKFILDAWGFKVVGEFVWNKGKIGRGSYNRNQHENLLVAIKGKMPTPAKLYSSIIEAPRGKHSEKPEIVYEMIEKMYPKRKYVELFARKSRKGWTSHGNQLKKPEKIWVCKICGNNKEVPKEEWSPHLRKKHTGTLPYPDEHYFIQIEK